MKRLQTVETLNVLGLACLILAGWSGKPGLLWACGFLLLLGVFPNPLADLIARGWLGLAEAIGKVMSKVILTLVYYLALVPLAWLCRPFTRETRAYFFDRGRPTTFVPVEKPFSREDFEKPW